MNRGRRSEKIFLGKDDCQAFIQVLIESTEMWNLRVSAYCLLPNHYHLLVQTPNANISRCMRHINGVYTQRFNNRHRCDGQLFRGRYKAILVSADHYLLRLVRYIHKNPIEAGLADQPENYIWSSHKAYLSIAKKWNWLNKAFIYSLLTENKNQWISRYRRFMAAEDDGQISATIEGKKWPSVIGPKDFVDWVKDNFYAIGDQDEIPQAKVLAPSAESIINHVCRFYETEPDSLYHSRRGVFNEPRNVAIYLIRSMRQDTLKEIGKQFGISTYSSVSSILERMKHVLPNDRGLRKRVVLLTEHIKKRQQQT